MVTNKKKKKKKDLEIGDIVRETRATKGKKRCGEILMILADDPSDPTMECVEVHPDELTPLEKGSDGLRTFKNKKSRFKHYTPRKKLFKKKVFEAKRMLEGMKQPAMPQPMGQPAFNQ